MILVIIGASCSGKTALMGECVAQGCSRIRTNTTRKRRSNEAFDAYNFVTREEFESLIREDKLVEYVVYDGEYYGVSRASVEEGGIVILEPEGFRNLVRIYGDSVYSIYIRVPAEERMARGMLRGDKQDTLMSRVQGDSVLFTDELSREAAIVLNSPKQKEYPLIAAMCCGLLSHTQ